MAMQQKYSEDTIILTEKGISRQLFMVLSGTVALYVNYKTEDEYLLGLCSKDTVFGELGVLCHEPSIYTAVAVTDVVAAVFSEFELETFVKTYPSRAIGIMRSATRMNRIFSLNLKLMLEDQKQEEKYLGMLSDILKKRDEEFSEESSDEPDSGSTEDEFVGKYRYKDYSKGIEVPPFH